MRQTSTTLLVAWMILTAVSSLAAQSGPARKEPTFKAPEAVSVTDITVPIAGNGTVVLEAVITARGKPQKVDVRRDVATLTPIAVQAVEDWKFSPATLADKNYRCQDSRRGHLSAARFCCCRSTSPAHPAERGRHSSRFPACWDHSRGVPEVSR